MLFIFFLLVIIFKIEMSKKKKKFFNVFDSECMYLPGYPRRLSLIL